GEAEGEEAAMEFLSRGMRIHGEGRAAGLFRELGNDKRVDVGGVTVARIKAERVEDSGVEMDGFERLADAHVGGRVGIVTEGLERGGSVTRRAGGKGELEVLEGGGVGEDDAIDARRHTFARVVAILQKGVGAR